MLIASDRIRPESRRETGEPLPLRLGAVWPGGHDGCRSVLAHRSSSMQDHILDNAYYKTPAWASLLRVPKVIAAEFHTVYQVISPQMFPSIQELTQQTESDFKRIGLSWPDVGRYRGYTLLTGDTGDTGEPPAADLGRRSTRARQRCPSSNEFLRILGHFSVRWQPAGDEIPRRRQRTFAVTFAVTLQNHHQHQAETIGTSRPAGLDRNAILRVCRVL